MTCRIQQSNQALKKRLSYHARTIDQAREEETKGNTRRRSNSTSNLPGHSLLERVVLEHVQRLFLGEQQAVERLLGLAAPRHLLVQVLQVLLPDRTDRSATKYDTRGTAIRRWRDCSCCVSERATPHVACACVSLGFACATGWL